MKVILSPAKKLNEKNCDVKALSNISFSDDSKILVDELKDFSLKKS